MSNKIVITITTGNEAFADESEEVSRILQELSTRIAVHGDVSGLDGKRLLDALGNKVGTVSVESC